MSAYLVTLGYHKIYLDFSSLYLTSLPNICVNPNLFFLFIFHVVSCHSSVSFILCLLIYHLPTHPLVGFSVKEGCTQTPGEMIRLRKEEVSVFLLPVSMKRKDTDKTKAMLSIPGRKDKIQTNRNAKWWQVLMTKIKQSTGMKSDGARLGRVTIIIVCKES